MMQQLEGMPSQCDKVAIQKWSTQRADAAEIASTIQRSIEKYYLESVAMLQQ